MEIVLVRHGEPEWVRNELNVVDPPLTDRGHMQAARMGDVLGRERFDIVVASPLRRAIQTAEPLWSALGREQAIEPFLEEIREPNWHGTPAELAAAAYKEERSRAANDRWVGLDGGEAPRDFVERIRSGADDFLNRIGVRRIRHTLPLWEVADPDLRIAFVAHAGTNGVLLCHMLGLDPVPWEWDRFVTRHASITRLRSFPMADGHTFSLLNLSDAEHLPADARTGAFG